MPMTNEQREILETRFLIGLMKRDAEVRRLRMYSVENAPLAEPPDYETAMEMQRMRGRTIRKREDD